jgi:hypothetical protein
MKAMVPLDLSIEKLSATLSPIPNHRRLRTLTEVSPAHKQARLERYERSHDSLASNLRRFAASSGLSVEEAHALFVGYDEHVHYLFSPETEVERNMKATADQVPRADVMSIADCRQQACHLSDEIFKYSGALNTILLAREDIIRKIWKKMSRAERKTILLAAWPNMNARHPDIDYSWKEIPTIKSPNDLKSAFIEAKSWPYINLEDLVTSQALLLFLNSRGHHQPVEFAYSDLELAPMGKLRDEFLACRDDNSENFTMAFLGRKVAEEYGEFIPWINASAAVESIKAGRTVHVDHGIQILTTQHRIWRFLLICAVLILKTETGTAPPCTESALSEPLQLTSNGGPYTSLDVIAREAPYCLPAQLNLPRLQALAKAQKDQAVDHAIALREDPAYFVEVTERYKSHRPEIVLDKEGYSHPHAKDYPIYNKAQRHMATDAHCAVFCWYEIHHRLTNLRLLLEKHGIGLNVDEDLPTDLFDALTETRFFLENISLDIIGNIKFEYRSSPHLRKYHFRDNPVDGNLHIYSLKQRLDIDTKDKVLEQVLQFINVLEDKGLRNLLGLHVLLDETERLMQDEPLAKALITPHIASYLSQLSIISECLHHFHLFQPWARKIESAIHDNRFRFKANYDKTFAKWGKLITLSGKFVDSNLFKLGNPRDGKFYYPVEQRRTRDTVSAMRAAETALDAFWEAANRHWLRYVGTTPAALVKHIMGERALQRTPSWIEPNYNPNFVGTEDTMLSSSVPFFGHSHDIDRQVTGSFKKLAMPMKEKKKTRGQADDKQQSITYSKAASGNTSLKSIIAVDKRAFKVFNTLFHSPDSLDQPGEIKWPNFLHAMVKAGFSAQKLQGSAWHFMPYSLDAERSIQFHEPHPGNKLPFLWARQYGRRLMRAFGWTRDSFTLA